MPTVYTENPSNWNELEPYVNKGDFIQELFSRETCYFYDACSFRYHAKLSEDAAKILLAYFKKRGGFVVVTRCILMELASVSGEINSEYLQYIRNIDRYGLRVYVIYEEDLREVMACCYATNAKINSFLIWSVRTIKGPVSTIEAVLERNEALANAVLKGKNADDRNLFRSFFSEVRNYKEQGDNLGEELLGICLHMLSQLPGEEDGKFCLLTDDKGAAGKIDRLFRRTPSDYRGRRIIMFSTPKLAQVLYNEKYIEDRKSLLEVLSAGSSGNVKVLGTQIYDLRSTEITLQREELADQIMNQSINITF